MGKIIAVTNQKGGVGKTTTAVNAAAGIAKLGSKVLLIDTDPQGNATSGVGVDKRSVKYSSYSIMVDDIKAEDKVCILVAHNGIARIVESYFREMDNEEFSSFGIKNCEVRRYDF